MQGRITKVLNMKPPEILAMIEEASGTRMFEDKKESAISTISKKEKKLEEIHTVRPRPLTSFIAAPSDPSLCCHLACSSCSRRKSPPRSRGAARRGPNTSSSRRPKLRLSVLGSWLSPPSTLATWFV